MQDNLRKLSDESFLYKMNLISPHNPEKIYKVDFDSLSDWLNSTNLCNCLNQHTICSEKAKKESDSFFVNYLFKKKISLISHTNVRKEILITHMANQSNTKRKNYTY